MLQTSQRKRRFVRCANQSPQIQLTTRDLAIIRTVAKHRFLRSSHVSALFGGSAQQILRRLHLLYHHGYLDRPRAQLNVFYRTGNQPLTYGLGNKGARLLEQEFSIPRRKVEWTAKNRTVNRYFLEHTLATADVMIALELSCRTTSGVRLIAGDELLSESPEATRKNEDPFKWSVTVRHNGRTVPLGIIPDKVFALEFEDRRDQRAYFFLEVDRATMPVMRRGLAQTSFYRKLLAYQETWKQGLHQSQFNFHRFRVLTVTTTPDRVDHLIQANRIFQDGAGSGVFIFVDKKSFFQTPETLTVPLRTGRDQVVTLTA